MAHAGTNIAWENHLAEQVNPLEIGSNVAAICELAGVETENKHCLKAHAQFTDCILQQNE